MSRAEVRQTLAATVSAVDGITGYPKRPKTPKRGDAWPLWRGKERQDGGAYLQSWAVVVFIGGDADQSDAFIDAHEDDLDDALDSELFVQAFTPTVLAVGGNDATALTITGLRE